MCRSSDSAHALILSHPHYIHQEITPGRHHVNITCLDRPDLRSDIADSLGGLPGVTLSRAAFSVASMPPSDPSSMNSVVSSDGKTNIAQVEMVIDVLGSPSVTSEQLQLSLYMSVCCSCPLMSDPLGTGASGTANCLPFMGLSTSCCDMEATLPEVASWV